MSFAVFRFDLGFVFVVLFACCSFVLHCCVSVSVCCSVCAVFFRVFVNMLLDLVRVLGSGDDFCGFVFLLVVMCCFLCYVTFFGGGCCLVGLECCLFACVYVVCCLSLCLFDLF